MRLNLTTLRWLLVIPAALFAFLFVFYAAGFLYLIFHPVTLLFIYATVAAIAVLAVLFGSYMAPACRSRVALSIFLLGTVVAISIAVDIKAWAELAVAISSGFLTTVVVYKKERVANAA